MILIFAIIILFSVLLYNSTNKSIVLISIFFSIAIIGIYIMSYQAYAEN